LPQIAVTSHIDGVGGSNNYGITWCRGWIGHWARIPT